MLKIGGKTDQFETALLEPMAIGLMLQQSLGDVRRAER